MFLNDIYNDLSFMSELIENSRMYTSQVIGRQGSLGKMKFIQKFSELYKYR